MKKQDVRKIIIEQALKMFIANGIKNVRMDDITQAIHISKRTIYEIFPNKEELLYSCIVLFVKRHNARYAQLMKECNGDVLAILAHLVKTHTDILSAINPQFYNGIASYVKVKEYLDIQRAKEKLKTLQFFREGARQGVFRKDVDFELFLNVVDNNQQTFIRENLYLKYSMLDFFRNFTLVLFRGLLTDDANHKLENLTNNK